MPVRVQAENIFIVGVVAWIVLFLIGTAQLNWDPLQALFPLDSRAGALMWQRAAGADAGPTGFLVSTCGYLYMITCACFGITAVLQRNRSLKLGSIAMMLLTWPFFLLSGTRNAFLAVSMPAVFTYVLLGRQARMVKFIVLAVALVALNEAFLIVISHRNTGFRDWIAGVPDEQEGDKPEVEHEGLNMLQELCYIDIYSYIDKLEPSWGSDYLVELVSIVPRAIWPGKPLRGVKYATWRGFADESGNSDIGLVATISTGLIGQGALEFGPLAGPPFSAFLMAIWCGLLARWWTQRASILRLILFMLGVGITFNLGRNITMIILWPIAFAYAIVRIVESMTARAAGAKRPLAGTPQTANPRMIRKPSVGSPSI